MTAIYPGKVILKPCADPCPIQFGGTGQTDRFGVRPEEAVHFSQQFLVERSSRQRQFRFTQQRKPVGVVWKSKPVECVSQ